jgi:hypothetical protein
MRCMKHDVAPRPVPQDFIPRLLPDPYAAQVWRCGVSRECGTAVGLVCLLHPSHHSHAAGERLLTNRLSSATVLFSGHIVFLDRLYCLTVFPAPPNLPASCMLLCAP